MTVQLRDSDGTVRLSGDLLASGGAAGEVLTQQADGTYAPAAAQPFYSVSKEFGAADFTSWDTTAVEILPPVGASKVARAFAGYFVLRQGTIAFSPSSVDLYVADDPAQTGGFSPLDTTGFGVGGTLDVSMACAVPTGAGVATESTIVPAGGGLFLLGSANLSLGNGTITATLLYTIIDLTP